MAGRPLERAYRTHRVAGFGLDASLADAGAHRGRVGRIGTLDGGAGGIDVTGGALAIRQLAFELPDQLAHRFPGGRLETHRVLDRLFPVALGLVDADQVA